MASGLFTALFNALSDPKSYYAMQKEMNLKAVAQTFFNSLAGKKSFDAVILPEDIGKPIIFDGQRAVRVRILGVHDLIIPEPCDFEDLEERKRVLSLHPIAYPESNIPDLEATAEPEGTVNDARLIDCFFRDGPESNGRLRGLTYRGTTLRSFSPRHGINYECLYAAGFEGPSQSFENGGYNENTPTGQEFPDGTQVTTKFNGQHKMEKIERALEVTDEVIQGIGAPSAAVFAQREIDFWADKNELDAGKKGSTKRSNAAYKRIQLYNYYVINEYAKEKGKPHRDWTEYTPKYDTDEKLLKTGVGGSATEGTGDSVTGIMHWSATSVSFCMRGTGFPARYGHSGYSDNIRYGKSPPWKAFSLIRQKLIPKLGDVVVKPAGHGRKSTTYTASHGDIIFKIDKEYAYTAGGNLGARGQFKQTRKIKLAEDGTILSPQPYIVILKKME